MNSKLCQHSILTQQELFIFSCTQHDQNVCFNSHELPTKALLVMTIHYEEVTIKSLSMLRSLTFSVKPH